jgi:ligand-binding sensor domain-containing protein
MPRGRPEPVLGDFGTGSADAYALAQTSSGVWAATERGLWFLGESGEAAIADPLVREPVYAVAALDNRVWIGGRRGLGVTWEGADGLFVPQHAEGNIYLSQPIIAVALTGDTLVVASRERILWRAPGGEWIVERLLTGDLGEITTLTGDDRGVWIGGVRGLAYFRFQYQDFRVFNTGGDLPGPVFDIAVSERYVWVATQNGLVRFQKRALLP